MNSFFFNKPGSLPWQNFFVYGTMLIKRIYCIYSYIYYIHITVYICTCLKYKDGSPPPPQPFTYPNRKCGGRQQWCHTWDQVLHLSLYADQWCNHLHEILKKNIADNQKLSKQCNIIDSLPQFISLNVLINF